MLQLGERMQYNHLARQKDAPDNQSVNDDFMFNPWVGVDLSRSTALDSLTIRLGAVLSMQRSRIHADGWKNATGMLAEVAADWRWLGLRETFYAGKNLMPLYPYYGAELNMGSPYYQSKTYSRTDVVAHIVRNRYVDLEAALNFHVAGSVFALWQQLSLRVYIDQNITRKQGNAAARSIRNMY